jgi:bifunctional non-homologous end joining protein LigD
LEVRLRRCEAVLPELKPMLASAGPIAAPEEDWAFEPKLDGWRALVSVDSRLSVRTRRGRDVTTALPELAPLADVLSGRRVVLDGELVARDGRGSSFYRLGLRLAAGGAPSSHRRLEPVSFVAFDLLYLDGEKLMNLCSVERRALLEQLGVSGPAWCTVSSHFGSGTALFAACVELGLEGLVAKRLSSTYRPGERSRDWIKAKTPQWIEAHAPRRLKPSVAA